MIIDGEEYVDEIHCPFCGHCAYEEKDYVLEELFTPVVCKKCSKEYYVKGYMLYLVKEEDE